MSTKKRKRDVESISMGPIPSGTSGRGRDSVEGEIRHAIRNAQESLGERLVDEIECHKNRIEELRRREMEMNQEIQYLRKIKNTGPQQSAIMEEFNPVEGPFGNGTLSFKSLLINEN